MLSLVLHGRWPAGPLKQTCAAAGHHLGPRRIECHPRRVSRSPLRSIRVIRVLPGTPKPPQEPVVPHPLASHSSSRLPQPNGKRPTGGSLSRSRMLRPSGHGVSVRGRLRCTPAPTRRLARHSAVGGWASRLPHREGVWPRPPPGRSAARACISTAALGCTHQGQQPSILAWHAPSVACPPPSPRLPRHGTTATGRECRLPAADAARRGGGTEGAWGSTVTASRLPRRVAVGGGAPLDPPGAAFFFLGWPPARPPLAAVAAPLPTPAREWVRGQGRRAPPAPPRAVEGGGDPPPGGVRCRGAGRQRRGAAGGVAVGAPSRRLAGRLRLGCAPAPTSGGVAGVAVAANPRPPPRHPSPGRRGDRSGCGRWHRSPRGQLHPCQRGRGRGAQRGAARPGRGLPTTAGEGAAAPPCPHATPRPLPGARRLCPPRSASESPRTPVRRVGGGGPGAPAGGAADPTQPCCQWRSGRRRRGSPLEGRPPSLLGRPSPSPPRPPPPQGV